MQYVQRIQAAYLNEESTEAPISGAMTPSSATWTGPGPRFVPSDAYEAAGAAGTGTSKPMSPEEEAEQERRLANRTFVWLAAGSFIFYALFGAALDLHIGDR
jgi:hypothetical protein